MNRAYDTLPDDEERDNSTLTLNHVVDNFIFSFDWSDGEILENVEENELVIEVVNGETFVNGIRVLKTDVLASNGIIHLIDGVIWP